MKGILGRKVGMTQIFSDHGASIPVTVIEVTPNVVTKVLTQESNGYKAVQLSAFDKKESRQNRPEQGHFKKANTTPKRFVKEIRNMEGFNLGDQVDASIFHVGQLVDATGISKGKGFAGSIKRHNQKIGPRSHGGGGGSQPVRQVGSLGVVTDNKVRKGKTMPGHLGHVQRTVQNLEIVLVDVTNNLLLVKGSIPGAKKSFVLIKEAVKGLPDHQPVKLVDLVIQAKLNDLFERARKFGHLSVNADMDVNEIEKLVVEAEKQAEASHKKDGE
ncbi:50S ribosomal protein L3 [Mycoplasmopsis agassizii]|uniref:Large ribosomal subunit protein uL3 n=1 Tax=Mycoplasmopsis agassizii TaxID=33922 RepID=A0A1W1X4E5_9BACT|nr:50S ribosomal protein L3 [Mycoplasmopsis agassizii]PAF55406.1 50S ribosomal protein L3 [Mycoplasmopsis agassizii]PAK21656.1 50S ribosomal protein L3 [Mycoplasmopsis agassizii]SMC18301.1 large subunit ribosomal protein L3 [Mycoplasmopsis agassizii]